jgi:hypothetical protein
MQIKVQGTGVIPFDSRNSFICSLSLVDSLDHAVQAGLHARVKAFNQTIEGDELKPRFFLEFAMNGDRVQIMHIRQRSDTRAPTRDLFDLLLVELGVINDTEDTVTQAAAVSAISQPTPEPATGRCRGPRGRFLSNPATHP